MKNVLTIGIIIVFAVLIGLLIRLTRTTDDRIDAIRKENEMLELRCDSISIKNDSIKIEMDRYSACIDSMKNLDKKLSADYIENQNQIKKIKQKYEKNNRIDDFSTPDIIRYFTDSL